MMTPQLEYLTAHCQRLRLHYVGVQLMWSAKLATRFFVYLLTKFPKNLSKNQYTLFMQDQSIRRRGITRHK
jgi:hypothetical protein